MSRLLVVYPPLLALVLAGTALAQAPDEAAKPAVDPDVVAAMQRMGSALHAMTSASIHADVTTEEVLTTGQKLQFSGIVEIKARRPDRLRMNLISERQDREIFYDGHTATIFSPRLGYFASFDAPPTIRELLQAAEARYDLQLPLVELLSWGPDSKPIEEVQSAFDVGTDIINGKDCEQYAMREEDRDLQIWIARGTNPLPCKMVITTTDDSSMPQYTAVLTWNAATSFPADTFAFKPPANSRHIAIGQVPSAEASGG